MESVKLDTKKKGRLMDKKQQESIANFYKEYFELDGYYMLNFLGTGFCAVFFIFFMFIPFQEARNDMYLQIMAIMWASYLYYDAYNSCRGNNKVKLIYDKLRYLPISEKQMRLYVLKKWCEKCTIIFAVSLIGQLYTTWEVYYEISWINVVYVLGMAFILPVAFSVFNLIFKEKGYVCMMIIECILILKMNS